MSMDHSMMGKKVTSEITGFTGTVTSVQLCLNGCVLLEVTHRVDKDGKPQEAENIFQQHFGLDERLSYHLLGKKVTDKLTGIKGTVTSAVKDMTGFVQVCITPRADKDGKVILSWVDEQRVDPNSTQDNGPEMRQIPAN